MEREFNHRLADTLHYCLVNNLGNPYVGTAETVRIRKPNGTFVTLAGAKTDHGQALHSIALTAGNLDQVGEYVYNVQPAIASDFRPVCGAFRVFDRYHIDLGAAYNAGILRLGLSLFRHEPRTIIATPLSDSLLTGLTLSVTDPDGANIISPLTKSDFTAGSGAATDRIYHQANKLVGVTGGTNTLFKLSMTYGGHTHVQDVWLASRFNA